MTKADEISTLSPSVPSLNVFTIQIMKKKFLNDFLQNVNIIIDLELHTFFCACVQRKMPRSSFNTHNIIPHFHEFKSSVIMIGLLNRFFSNSFQHLFGQFSFLPEPFLGMFDFLFCCCCIRAFVHEIFSWNFSTLFDVFYHFLAVPLTFSPSQLFVQIFYLFLVGLFSELISRKYYLRLGKPRGKQLHHYSVQLLCFHLHASLLYQCRQIYTH